MRIPRWRKATWALVIWNVLILAWVISGANAVSKNCAGLTGAELSGCEAGTAVGGTLAFSFIAMIWFIGFVVLALVWLMSRPSKRQCPRCGNDVKKGLTVCPSCQYEFGHTAAA